MIKGMWQPPEPALLKQAAGDFAYLLDRGYPRVASLGLVGNRYRLDATARQVLHRGVFSAEAARGRRARLRRLAELTGEPLGVDGHNVLITLECALKGLPLVTAADGFIRDVAQLSRAYRASPATDAALELLGRYLAGCRVGPVSVFFDAPLSKSGELARLTGEVLSAATVEVQSRAVAVPERELLDFTGAIATSDTHLLDRHPLVVDLAGEIIISQQLSKNLLKLDELDPGPPPG